MILFREGNWNLKQKVIDRSIWRIGFGSGHGPVAGQTTQ